MALTDQWATPADVARECGKDALNRGNFAAAATQFARARRLHLAEKERIQAARDGLYLSQALIESGALDEADAVLSKLATETTEFRTHAAPLRENLGRVAYLRGEFDSAATHLSQACEIYGARAFTDPQQAACANALAALQIAVGEYEAADRSLKTALDVCEKLPAEVGPRLPLEVRLQRALVAAATGQYQSAIVDLKSIQAEAQAAGFTTTAAACTANLGFAQLQSGDAATAIRNYDAARRAYNDAGDTVSGAICRLNMAVAGRINGTATAESAIADYKAARATLHATGRHDLAATCVLNIGVEFHGTGDLSAARGHYVAARDAFEQLHGQARSMAICELGLGRLHIECGEDFQARELLTSAQARFRRLGLDEWAARCSVELSAALPEETAVSTLLPALLALDSIRFQFPTAASRLAWRATTEHATRRAFELAHRLDQQGLLAELIETSINSGIHTVHGRDTGLKTIPDAHPSAAGTAPTSGTGRLLAGAELPLVPAPGLRMTPDRVALITSRRIARRLYPALTGQDRARTTAGTTDVTIGTW